MLKVLANGSGLVVYEFRSSVFIGFLMALHAYCKGSLERGAVGRLVRFLILASLVLLLGMVLLLVFLASPLLLLLLAFLVLAGIAVFLGLLLALLAPAGIAVAAVALRRRTALGHHLLAPVAVGKTTGLALRAGIDLWAVRSQQCFHQPTIVRRRSLQALGRLHVRSPAIAMLHGRSNLSKVAAAARNFLPSSASSMSTTPLNPSFSPAVASFAA